MGPAGKKIFKWLTFGLGISGALAVSVMAGFLAQECPNMFPCNPDTMIVYECPPDTIPPVDRLVGNYYVHPDGHDFNGGESRGDPFRTILRGIDALSYGDTLLVLTGIYFERPVISRTKGTTILAEPGTVLDCEGETVPSSSACFVIAADRTVVKGFEIKNSPASAIIITNCDDSGVYNCKLHANWQFGFSTYMADNPTAMYNDIYDNGRIGGGYLTHGIYLRLDSNGANVSRNNIYGNVGCDIHVNGQFGRHFDNVVINNNFCFNNGGGFNFMNNYDSEYTNNISFNNRTVLGPGNGAVEFTSDAGENDPENDALGSDRFICTGNIIITTDIANGIQVDRGPWHGVTSDGYISECIVVTPMGIAHIEDWGDNTIIDWSTIIRSRWTSTDMKALFTGGEMLFLNPIIPVDENGYCEDVEIWRSYFDIR